jgi:hypothetical protein
MLRSLGLLVIATVGACAAPVETTTQATQAANESGWPRTTIADRPDLDPVDYETVSLAIDRQGGRHLAFVGGDSYVHYRGPSGPEKVFDEAGADAARPKLALGADGEPQVAFTSDPYGWNGSPIRLASHTAAGWQVAEIGKTGEVDALAIDAGGTVHIASSDAAAAPTYWRATVSTKKPGTVFVHTEVPRPSSGRVSWNTFGFAEVLLMATAPLEIGGESPTTHFARRTSGGTFQLQRLPVDGSTGALARDANGNLHAVVSSRGLSGTHSLYLRRGANDTAWSAPDPIEPFRTSYYSSIAVDARGTVHVAFSTNNANALVYARKSGSSWTSDAVFEGQAQLPSLALDPSGAPVIAYRSGPSYWLASP